MSLVFFDANAFIGRRVTGSYRPAMSAEALLAQMDASGISEALVWHVSQYDWSPADGNAGLSAAISGADRLYGCWTLLPPQTGELPAGDAFFEKMKSERICALRAFPAQHRYLLRRAVFGAFLDRVTEKRIPLILSAEAIGWPGIYDILGEYPDLSAIVCNIGAWGSDRYFRPLLENFRNVCLETASLFASDGSLERAVRDYGAGRLVFGSGFPDFVPEASMLCLLHADIAEQEKRMIASLNMKRMISEARP